MMHGRAGRAGFLACERGRMRSECNSPLDSSQPKRISSTLEPPSVGAEVRGVYRTYQAARTYPGNGE